MPNRRELNLAGLGGMPDAYTPMRTYRGATRNLFIFNPVTQFGVFFAPAIRSGTVDNEGLSACGIAPIAAGC
jgi:hypothetical protein